MWEVLDFLSYLHYHPYSDLFCPSVCHRRISYFYLFWTFIDENASLWKKTPIAVKGHFYSSLNLRELLYQSIYENFYSTTENGNIYEDYDSTTENENTDFKESARMIIAEGFSLPIALPVSKMHLELISEIGRKLRVMKF